VSWWKRRKQPVVSECGKFLWVEDRWEQLEKVKVHWCMKCDEEMSSCPFCEKPYFCGCGGYVGRFFTLRDITKIEQAIINGRKPKHTYMAYGRDCCEKCEEKSEVLDIDKLEKEGWC